MSANPIYKDAARSIEERVDDLIGQMTLAEKIAQLGSLWVYELLDGTTFSETKAARLMAEGLGQVTRLGGASNVLPTEAAALANRIQKYLIEETRLGVPAVIHEECCSGYMARGATVFPQAIGVASTWEPELVRQMTDVIRAQMRSVGAHHALAPVLDVTRDARWGRVEETFGEDPYLVSRMGVAYVRGLQGDDLRQGIVATGKHFVGYGMSEGGMNWAPAHLSERDMHEVFLLPFEAAIREAGLASIMNAYHELDGVPCGASRRLLTEILRDAWGFDGTVVSDYFAINMLYEYHKVAADKSQAAGMAIEAGLDIELPKTDCYGDPIRVAVESGAISEALLDTVLRRILRQKFAVGVFDAPYVDDSVVVFDTPEQRGLAREIARKSITLLKNAGDLLPLAKDAGSIAVIGPNADNTRNLFGDYAYPAHMETLIEQTRENNVFGMPIPEGVSEVEDFIPVISVLEAIKRAAPQKSIRYAQGCTVRDDSTEGFAEAVAAARAADVAVIVVGDKAGLTDDCTSGEARDRAVITLPGVQADLVRAVYETGTPVVLVLISGRPVALEWMADDIPAILAAWFPGEEGGEAVAEALFGDINPGGKLPISFPRTAGQVPVFYNHKPSGGRSHWKIDYVDTPVSPLYAFGHGLSYTQFTYSNLRIEPAQAAPGETVRIRADVTNTGARPGEEVTQLYIHDVIGSVTRPVKELKGFVRLALEPGQTRTVTFELPVNQLACYGVDMQLIVEPGTIEVMVGGSSADLPLQGAFEITGDTTVIAEKVFSSAVSIS